LEIENQQSKINGGGWPPFALGDSNSGKE